MRQRRSPQILPRDDRRLLPLRALQTTPAFWGRRRIWADQRFGEPWPINKQRIGSLMREPHQLVPPNLELKAKWTPTRSQSRPTKPQEWDGVLG